MMQRHLRIAVLLLAIAAPFTLSAADHPAAAREMAGVWLPDSRRSGRLPPWPLNGEAKQAAEHYQQKYGPIDPTIDDANISCLPESMPYSMRLLAQYPFEILFTQDRVTVFFEIYGGVRRIRLDPNPGSLEVLASAMGQSFAHWEGDTLVVETTNIRKEGFGIFSGNPPASNARRIVERISLIRNPDGTKQLRNEITIHDRVVLNEPVKVEMFYKWSPDIEVGEYLCQQDIWDQNVQGSPSSVPWRQ